MDKIIEKKILKNELKPPEMGIFWMEKLQKNFFFTFSPIPGPNIPKAIKKSKISIIIKNMRK